MRKKGLLRGLYITIVIILLVLGGILLEKGMTVYKLNNNCIEYFHEKYESAIDEFGLEFIKENWKLVALYNGEKYEVGVDGDFNTCHSAAIYYSHKLEREIGAAQAKKHATELGLKLLPLHEFLEYALSLESLLISYSNDDQKYNDEIVKQMKNDIGSILYFTPKDLRQTGEFESKVEYYMQLLNERSELLSEGSSDAFQFDPYFYEEFAIPIYEDLINNDSENHFTLPTITFEPFGSKHWSDLKITEGTSSDWYRYVSKMKEYGKLP